MPRRLPVGVWRAAFWAIVVFGVYWALREVADAGPFWPYEDKVKHAAAFAVLAGLGWRAGYLHVMKLGLGLLALGAAIELAQSFTTWRSAEWGDLLADAMGIGIGLWLAPRVLRQPAEHRG